MLSQPLQAIVVSIAWSIIFTAGLMTIARLRRRGRIGAASGALVVGVLLGALPLFIRLALGSVTDVAALAIETAVMFSIGFLGALLVLRQPKAA